MRMVHVALATKVKGPMKLYISSRFPTSSPIIYLRFVRIEEVTVHQARHFSENNGIPVFISQTSFDLAT
jgi:hypothetical protein